MKMDVTMAHAKYYPDGSLKTISNYTHGVLDENYIPRDAFTKKVM